MSTQNEHQTPPRAEPPFAQPPAAQTPPGQPPTGRSPTGQPPMQPPTPAPMAPSPTLLKSRNGFGTSALVLGVLSAVFGFVPLFGVFVAVPLGLIAIVFGVLGWFRTRSGRATNVGASIAGGILGIVGVIVSIGMFSMIYNAAGGGPAYGAAASGSGTTTSNADTSATATARMIVTVPLR